MTAKIDGTNGVLQAYDYQTPSTGFSYTFSAGAQTLLMVPAGTLATGTITMPASPADGMVITFSSSQQITALTLQGNTGQSISSAVTFLPAKTAAAYVYRLSNTTWYPTETVPGTGSQLVSGVSQASTSGTSIDFTGIPSGVKRITLMLRAVSTSGTSLLRVQIGGGSLTTSGYVGCTSAIVSGTAGSNSFAGGGWDFNDGAGSASASRTGIITIANINSNSWVMQGMYSDPVSSSRSVFGSGWVSTAATLDQLRVTTVNGTDTFDAGTINILYE